MHQKKVDSYPHKCDFCGKDATYDAPSMAGPSMAGPWGNFCEECAKTKCDTLGVGTHFVLRGPKVKKARQTVLMALEATLVDELIDDADRYVKCPHCGEERFVEMDASYVFECEGCGSRVKVTPLI